MKRKWEILYTQQRLNYMKQHRQEGDSEGWWDDTLAEQAERDLRELQKEKLHRLDPKTLQFVIDELSCLFYKIDTAPKKEENVYQTQDRHARARGVWRAKEEVKEMFLCDYGEEVDLEDDD